MKVSIQYDKNGKSKVDVKIEGRDLWSGDVTLAQVIYPFLKKYRNLYKGKNPMRGYPASFPSGSGSLDTIVRSHDSNDSEGLNKWLECLDKMVYSFGWIAKGKDWDGPEMENMLKESVIVLKPYRKELKKLAKQDKERFAALKGSGALSSLKWDRESELMQPIYEKYFPLFDAHHAKVQEGIDLFAKHFGSLWT